MKEQNVVVVMIDATEGVTEQDAKIAGIAHENGKGVIIAVNKWDAIEKNDKTIYQYYCIKYADVLVVYAICRNYVYFCPNGSETYQII